MFGWCKIRFEKEFDIMNRSLGQPIDYSVYTNRLHLHRQLGLETNAVRRAKVPWCRKLLTELRNPQVQQAWKSRPVQEREHGRVHVPEGVPGQQTFVNIVIFLVVTGILTWSFHIRRYKYLYPRHHGYLGSGFWGTIFLPRTWWWFLKKSGRFVLRKNGQCNHQTTSVLFTCI